MWWSAPHLGQATTCSPSLNFHSQCVHFSAILSPPYGLIIAFCGILSIKHNKNAFPLRGRWILRSKRRMRWIFLTDTAYPTPHQSLRDSLILTYRFGRCFCFAEVSTGHPHPQGEAVLFICDFCDTFFKHTEFFVILCEFFSLLVNEGFRCFCNEFFVVEFT